MAKNDIKGAKLMENKIARFMRNTGAIRFFLPLGIILVVLGAFMVKTTPDQYAETLGRVTGVEQYREDDKDVCDIEFEYAKIAQQYNMQIEDEKKALSAQEGQFRNNLKMQRIEDFLYENNQ